MKKVEKSSSAGTTDESSTNVQAQQVSQPIAKRLVMRRFLFQYRFDGGADFNVTLDDVNMNKAMEQFSKKYHQVDKVYSIDEVASNGA